VHNYLKKRGFQYYFWLNMMQVKAGVLAEDLSFLVWEQNCRRTGSAVRSCSLTGLLVLYRSSSYSVGNIPCLRSVDHGQLDSELKTDEQQGNGCDHYHREHDDSLPEYIDGDQLEFVVIAD
jgi:hypothetical protein